MPTSNINLLEQIESISRDGLDPLHTRESLVLKMKAIYKLAVLADGDDESDDDEGDGE